MGNRVYVWIDVIAINQHGVRRDEHGHPDKTAEAERTADLASLEDVIKHAGHVILYFEPLSKPRALSRLWVLFELMTVCCPQSPTPGEKRPSRLRPHACVRVPCRSAVLRQRGRAGARLLPEGP